MLAQKILEQFQLTTLYLVILFRFFQNHIIIILHKNNTYTNSKDIIPGNTLMLGVNYSETAVCRCPFSSLCFDCLTAESRQARLSKNEKTRWSEFTIFFLWQITIINYVLGIKFQHLKIDFKTEGRTRAI